MLENRSSKSIRMTHPNGKEMEKEKNHVRSSQFFAQSRTNLIFTLTPKNWAHISSMNSYHGDVHDHGVHWPFDEMESDYH